MAMPSPPLKSHAKLEDGTRTEPGGLPVPPPSEEVPTFIVFMNVINTVTHLLLGGVAVGAFFYIDEVSHIFPVPPFTPHVYLTVIGYTILVSQALLSLTPKMGWKKNFMYPQKTKVYWFLQVIGSTVAVVGGGVGIAASELRFGWTPYHFYSTHQIIGFTAMMFTCVSLVGGVVPLVAANTVNTSFYKAIYACVSTCALILAYVAIILAFDYFRFYLLSKIADLLISFSVLAVVGMLTMWIANFVVVGLNFFVF